MGFPSYLEMVDSKYDEVRPSGEGQHPSGDAAHDDPDDLTAWVLATVPRTLAYATSLLRNREQTEVSFTFDRFGSQPDSAYQVSGHLEKDDPVIGPDQPLRRRHELLRFFGSRLIEGE